MVEFIRGLPQFEAALEGLITGMDVATRVGIVEAGAVVEGAVKRKLKTSSHAKGTSTPSAPGEPPSTVTGNLARSVQSVGPVRLGYGSYTMSIGPTAKYARIQELGGTIVATSAQKLVFKIDGQTIAVDSVTLPARPYVQPALLESYPEQAAAYKEAWRIGQLRP